MTGRSIRTSLTHTFSPFDIPVKVGMESLFGLVGKDFTLTVSDSNAGRSIMLFKDDEDKSRDLGKFVTMFYCGEPGDTVNVHAGFCGESRSPSPHVNTDPL